MTSSSHPLPPNGPPQELHRCTVHLPHTHPRSLFEAQRILNTFAPSLQLRPPWTKQESFKPRLDIVRLIYILQLPSSSKPFFVNDLLHQWNSSQNAFEPG